MAPKSNREVNDINLEGGNSAKWSLRLLAGANDDAIHERFT
jgi:hypothetical protein